VAEKKPRKGRVPPAGPTRHWREELAEKKALWATRNLVEINDAIEDDVFARALRGERLAPIARWYGADSTEFYGVYGEVWRLGFGQQQNDSIADMIETGRKSGIPVMKMMGHKVALGIENLGTTIEDTPAAEDPNSFQINVTVIRKPESDGL
jgi:hypothetical protein